MLACTGAGGLSGCGQTPEGPGEHAVERTFSGTTSTAEVPDATPSAPVAPSGETGGDLRAQPGGASAPVTLSGETGLDLRVQLGGASYAVAARDTLVFLGIGPRVVVFDLVDPARPVQIGQSPPLRRVVRDILLAGELAYVAVDSAGLAVLDIRDVTAPVVVGALDTDGSAVGLALADDTLLLADYRNGLLVLDVGDPTQPRLVGAWPAPNRIVDVAVDAQLAYALDEERGVQILDLADPSAPRLLGASDRGNSADSIAIHRGYAYVTTLRESEWGWGYEFVVFAVADPAQARVIRAQTFSSTYRDADILFSGDMAYLGGDAVAVFDVSDPAHPVPVGEKINPPDAQRGCAYCVGALALVPGAIVGARGAEGGMVIFDPSAPGQPSILATHFVPGFQEAVVDLVVDPSGPTLAAGDHLIDLSDPMSPTYLADTPWSLGSPGYSPDYQMAFTPGYAVISTLAGSNWLEVWPWPWAGQEGSGIGILTHDNYCSGASDIAIGRHVYAVGGSGIPDCLPFLVVDITDPESPTVVGRLPAGDPNDDIDLQRLAVDADGTTVYAVGFDPLVNRETWQYDARLTVIDAGDPTNPRILGHIDLKASLPSGVSPFGESDIVAIPSFPPAEKPDVALADRLAVVAFNPGSVVVVDVSDPARPYIVGALGLPSRSASEVEVAWPYAFVAGGNSVALVDLSHPSSPALLDSLEIPGTVQAMTLVGDQAWILASQAGLVGVERRPRE